MKSIASEHVWQIAFNVLRFRVIKVIVVKHLIVHSIIWRLLFFSFLEIIRPIIKECKVYMIEIVP